MLGRKLETAAASAAAAATAAEQAAAAKQQQADYERMLREARKSQPRATTATRRAPAPRAEKNPITDFLGSSAGKSVMSAVVKGIFGTLRRR